MKCKMKNGKLFEKLLQNPLTLSRHRYIIKTQKRKGERKMTGMKFFEIVVGTLKKEYGEMFEALSQEEKQNVTMIFAHQVAAENPEIMQALARAVYADIMAE